MTNFKKNIKPLSVNEAWQGKKFKTDKYKAFEKKLLFTLPSLKEDKLPEMIRIEFVFGFSNKSADLDNPVKPLLDILQKKYGFNDSHVWEMEVFKKLVPKGDEYFEFRIIPCFPF